MKYRNFACNINGSRYRTRMLIWYPMMHCAVVFYPLVSLASGKFSCDNFSIRFTIQISIVPKIAYLKLVVIIFLLINLHQGKVTWVDLFCVINEKEWRLWRCKMVCFTKSQFQQNYVEDCNIVISAHSASWHCSAYLFLNFAPIAGPSYFRPEEDFNLMRDLDVPKRRSLLLGSRLQQWNDCDSVILSGFKAIRYSSLTQNH